MSIIAFKHLNRELLLTLAVTLAALFLMAVGGRFIGYLQEAVLGKYPAAALLTIIGLRLPGFLQLLLPFALFVATLLTFSRLHADREFSILQVSRATHARPLLWVLPSTLLVVLATGGLSLHFTPASNVALAEFLAEQRAEMAFERLRPGAFHRFQGNRITRAEGMAADGRSLTDVFLAEPGGSDSATFLFARRARPTLNPVSGNRYLLLQDGVRLSAESTGAGERRQLIEFSALSQKLAPGASTPRPQALEARSSLALWRSPGVAEAAELHWRIGLPVFAAIALLIAFGLAPVRPGGGRFSRILPGMLVLIGYYLCLLVNQYGLAAGVLPPALGLWPAHAPFAGLAWYLFNRIGVPARR